MELTTSSARQDTAPLGRILPDKKPATPATFVTSAPAGAMDNPALPGHYPALPGHYPALPKALQMNIQLVFFWAPCIADEHAVVFFSDFH